MVSSPKPPPAACLLPPHLAGTGTAAPWQARALRGVDTGVWAVQPAGPYLSLPLHVYVANSSLWAVVAQISTCKSFEKKLKSIYQGRKAEKYGMCYKPLHHWEDTSDAELSSIVKQVFITAEIQAQTQESPEPTLLPLA